MDGIRIDMCLVHMQIMVIGEQSLKKLFTKDEYQAARIKYINGEEPCLEAKSRLWVWVEDQMKKFKSSEMKLRKEICNEIFDGEEGKFTKKQKFPDSGFELSATSKVNVKFDNDILNDIVDDLDDDEEECLKRSIAPVISGLNKLYDSSILWRAVEEKPATPELKVKMFK